jgi:hypothetical protein
MIISLLTSSTTGTQPSSPLFGSSPFLIIVMGSPFSPVSDQFVLPFTVEPKRIELPHLPSCIKSPSKGKSGFTFVFSINV